jgi:hypothetical protein
LTALSMVVDEPALRPRIGKGGIEFSVLQSASVRKVRFGRKLKLTSHQRQEAIARREAGEALVDIARTSSPILHSA